MIRQILKSLMKPDAYPEPTSRVELVQTHVSYIFLTDSHAYKVKKPVDFGFLNFSSIDRRRFYCNEEVRLNRRLCTDVYEGVVELRETPAGAAFHGTGPVIDYAVKMRRLPADGMLDRLVDTGQASSVLIRRVASIIARFHRDAATSPAISDYGRLERIMYNWQENFEQTVPFEGSTLPAPERMAIKEWIEGFAADNSDLFQMRVDSGLIRECDGDIHLENICVDGNEICIFDCIEFNERFRCSDTAADIAFLLMDLDYHGRHDLAEAALDEYLAVSNDREAVALIDFYRIYRAFVRGKVESFRMNDVGIAPEERSVARLRAIRYFRLARGYLERRVLPSTLFITCGLMGSGKSTLAGQLAFELGLPVRSSDETRKQRAGLPADQPNRDGFGQGLYSSPVTDETYADLLRWADGQLINRQSIIIDAAFIDKNRRRPFADLARRHSACFCILYLTCGEQETRRRLQQRETDSSSISDGRNELLADQSRLFEPPDSTEGMLLTLNSTHPAEELTSEIYRGLASC